MKAIKQNWQMVVVCVAMLATALFIILAPSVFGSITSEQPTQTDNAQLYTFFSTSTNQVSTGIYSTTTTATSTNITSWFDSNGRLVDGKFNVAGAKKVVFYFTRGDKLGGGNTGSTQFRVQGSPDGSSWYYFDRFVNATSTGTLNPGALAATTTLIASMDLTYTGFKFVRCIAVETTDGSHECSATAEY